MSPPSLRHPARMAGASLLRLQSDERLAELAADGHEAAFDAIVDRYRTPLTRYCAGIVGPSRAEDAAQQALINAHDALQRTDEVRHLRSWLYRIAHNASLNVLRAVRDDVSLDAASDATAVTEDGPAAAFERSERFRATVDALRELPERQRAALVLRELEGRSHEEIAATLGVTKGSARQHLMRARVALRAAVTAITPYPLIVRLAEMVAGPGATGWADAAVGAGAGAGATLAKLTAGVAATGALVGGAVGTERVVHHRHSGQDAAQRSPGGSATTVRPAKARVVSLPATAAAGSGASADGSGRGPTGSGPDDRKGKDKNDDRGDDNGRDHDGSRRRGPDGNRGGDDSSAGRRAHHRRGSSGSGDGSDHGSRHGDDSSGRGRGGGGGDDDGKRHGSGGSSSSGSDGSSEKPKRDGSGSSGGSRDSGGELSTRGGESRDERPAAGSDSGSSGSSGRDSGDDRSGSSTTTAAPVTAPVTTSPTGSGSDDGSGSSESSGNDDASGSSPRSDSPDGSGSGG